MIVQILRQVYLSQKKSLNELIFIPQLNLSRSSFHVDKLEMCFWIHENEQQLF